MSTLGNRARRLQANTLQPLERLRSDIQFELITLQLEKKHWTEMVNQSLIHLKSTQYFITQDSVDISYNKSTSFKLRYLKTIPICLEIKSIMRSDRHHLQIERASDAKPTRNVETTFERYCTVPSIVHAVRCKSTSFLPSHH